jgi:hypothetical protein
MDNITHRNLLWERIASINARINKVNMLLDSVEETICEMSDFSEFITKEITDIAIEQACEVVLDRIAEIEFTPEPDETK